MIGTIRRSTGISHKNLAALLGVSPSMVQFAEQGHRSLGGDAAKKLLLLSDALPQPVTKVKKMPAAPVYNNPGPLAKKHAAKAEDYRYLAGRLQYQLQQLLQRHQQLQGGLALLQALKHAGNKLYTRTERDQHITSLLEFFSRDKLDRVNKKIDQLQDKLAVHLAYAEVHERRERVLEGMGKKKG